MIRKIRLNLMLLLFVISSSSCLATCAIKSCAEACRKDNMKLFKVDEDLTCECNIQQAGPILKVP